MTQIHNIFNFAQVNDKLGTAGQPTREQFRAIKEAGYQMVINLASGITEHDLAGEAEIVAGLDMTYHHIPVDWEKPADDDLEQFFALMEANQSKKLFVHCIANYRASAFTMLYRVIKQGVPLAEAKAFKESVWKPEEVYPIWDTFIEKTLKKYGVRDN